MSENRVIGKDNKLPWHIPEDLKFFRQTTLGKPVIMGRKTFESMGSKPLPNRLNIILTQDTTFTLPQNCDETCRVAHSVEEALALSENSQSGESSEIMVIGGAKVFEQFLPKASRIYLSIVPINIEGDTYFPEINNNDWQISETIPKEQFTIQILDRKNFS